MIDKNIILQYAEDFYQDIVSVRQHLHQYPELSFHEFKTSDFIASKLDEYGISYQKGYVKTGIVATIEGNNPGCKTIALRSDMDALPVYEDTQVQYQSANTGIMHACGHDIHMASLLGGARILKECADAFEGTVLVLFQPGEEKLPGGAKLMLEEGIFHGREPDVVLAQHVDPELPLGSLGFKSGMYMASADELYLTIRGRGGHAGIPDQLTDTVFIASSIIVMLQQIVSRNTPPYVPSVLSFGKIDAPGATNIIPDRVEISGTFRTMNEEWRAIAHQRIIDTASSIAIGAGGDVNVDIQKGYPFLVNNEEITKRAMDAATEYKNGENVIPLGIKMIAEDFAYFSQKYPSLMYRLGVGGSTDSSHNLHSAKLKINDSVLKTGMGAMAWLALKFLD
jgi:amidohydrolase